MTDQIVSEVIREWHQSCYIKKRAINKKATSPVAMNQTQSKMERKKAG